MKIVGVTACTACIAHTYIVKEKIIAAAQELGHEIKLETQGSIGIENAITAEDVASADAVILTTDMPIKNVERFDNLKKVKVGISPAIKQADAIVAKMISMLNA